MEKLTKLPAALLRSAGLLVAVGAICVPVGCGGESVADGTGIEEYAHELRRALTKPDCVALNGINLRAQEATFRYRSLSCPAERDAGKLFRGFEITGSEAYGTAAVVDYRTKDTPKGATMLLVRAPNGDWVLNTLRMPLGKPTAGTSDADDRDGYDEAVSGYIRGLRDNDCRAFFKYAETFNYTAKTACSGELPIHAGIRTELKADPDAEPEYLGGNSSFGFYGIDIEQPMPGSDHTRSSYHTFVVAESQTKPPSYLVLTTSNGPVAD